MNISKTDEMLTRKRCGILLVTACIIYFLLNIYIVQQQLVSAFTGAFCASIAFGILLYFIKVVRKELRADKNGNL
jgi:hypothetical protein